MAWGHGPSSRMPAHWVQTPVPKKQTNKKEWTERKKKERKSERTKLGILKLKNGNPKY
jgi:hypothetical protein